MINESALNISGGQSLDGVTQGDGTHLVGQTITITERDWTEVEVDDSGFETNFADGDFGQTLNGAQTHDGVNYNDDTRIEAEYQLFLTDPNTNITYRAVGVNIIDSNPPYATIEGLAFIGDQPPRDVALTVTSSAEGMPNSGSGTVRASQFFVPLCVTEDTLIRTAAGDSAVQDLKVGDLITGFGGQQHPLRKVLRQTFDARALADNPRLRPVLIEKGALGQGLPERDLRVSRQHRMLVSSRIAERMFGAAEVLLPAIHLTRLPGISVDMEARDVSYFHMIFDDHRIILAEGAPTESLYPGVEALQSMPPELSAELLLIFPQLDLSKNPLHPARPIPERKRQLRLVDRHRKNKTPVLQSFG
ncbi:Hint domain-containing protein [Paracoccaceae bacterium GXU_MW_L88]